MKYVSFPIEESLSSAARKALREGCYYLDESVKEVVVTDEQITLKIHASKDEDAFAADLNALITATIKNHRRVREKKIYECKGVGVYDENPTQILLNDGVLLHHGVGRYSYSGWLVEFIYALDRVFQDYALKKGAIDEIYPPTVTAANMVRAGYVNSFPHHGLFVAPIKRSTKVLEDVTRSRIDPISVGPQHLGQPEIMLAPTVCYRCFEARQHQNFTEGSALFTAIGHCNRNEGFIDDDLTRVQSFLMREIIFIGDESYVKKARSDTVIHAQEFAESHGLKVRICSASDPFFASTSGEKSTYQSVAQTKLEMQLYLPYADKWLSCISFNNHQKTLVGAFDIHAACKETHSGCTGYGYDRLLFGILSQYGPRRENLPESFQKLIAENGR